MLKFRIAYQSAAILLAACAPVLTGCGSGKFFVPTCQETNSCGGGGANSSYAYVANVTTGSITTFPVPTAAFTSLTGTVSSLGTPLSALAATPKGTFLYVATVSGSVLLYTIATNGALTLANNGQAVASILKPTWLTVDPSGNWLFAVSNSSNQLLEFQIDPSAGTLTQASQSPIRLDTGNPTQVYVTPDNNNVYVGLGTGGLDGFPFNSSTGALSNGVHLSTKGTTGASDNAITADNSSTFLFVGETGQGIRVLTIGANASLSEISGSPFPTQLGPSSIVVDPTNKYVYVANRTSNVITGYTLGTTGALTALGSSPFTTGTSPVAMSLDTTGKYLFVINNGGSPDMQVFSFDATTAGKIDSVTTTATGTDPTNPISLAIVP